MKHRLLLAAASLALVTGLGSPTAAVGSQDRYCLQGRVWGYPGNCQFASYAQCMATASGTHAYCGVNPRYAYARRYRGYR
ncbi:hypothetical protein ACVWZK_003719 [Bradyrhizobium sp. GM0.4]